MCIRPFHLLYTSSYNCKANLAASITAKTSVFTISYLIQECAKMSNTIFAGIKRLQRKCLGVKAITGVFRLSPVCRTTNENISQHTFLGDSWWLIAFKTVLRSAIRQNFTKWARVKVLEFLRFLIAILLVNNWSWLQLSGERSELGSSSTKLNSLSLQFSRTISLVI